MKKFRACAFLKEDLEKEVAEYYEDLGQAMIWVKHFGQRQFKNCGNAEDYLWNIENKDDTLEQDDFERAYGAFDAIGRPIINQIKTYEK